MEFTKQQFWFYTPNIVLRRFVVLMINNKFGSRVFSDYLKGKYFHPKREERVFMFADMRDATTIA